MHSRSPEETQEVTNKIYERLKVIYVQANSVVSAAIRAHLKKHELPRWWRRDWFIPIAPQVDVSTAPSGAIYGEIFWKSLDEFGVRLSIDSETVPVHLSVEKGDLTSDVGEVDTTLRQTLTGFELWA